MGDRYGATETYNSKRGCGSNLSSHLRAHMEETTLLQKNKELSQNSPDYSLQNGPITNGPTRLLNGSSVM
jgi:hypothetical protein